MLDQGTGPGRRASTASSGSPSPAASASSTPPRPTAPSPLQEVVRAGARGPQADLPRHQGHAPRRPAQMLEMLDERLAALGTDYVDLFFIHGLGDDHSARRRDQPGQEQGVQGGGRGDPEVGQGEVRRLLDPPQGPRRRSSRRRPRAGSSTRSCSSTPPGSTRTRPLNKALDACHEEGDRPDLDEADRRPVLRRQAQGEHPRGGRPRGCPMLAERKLTPFQGLLHAIWTDERISCVCVSMRNTDQIRENTDAARRFEPLKTAEIHQLRDAVLAPGPTLCADCDGRCSVAAGTDGRARQPDPVPHLPRAPRRPRRGPPPVRRALRPRPATGPGADLEAARAACPNQLDFARLLPEVDRHLA